MEENLFPKYIILATGCFQEELPTSFTSFVGSLVRAGILKDEEIEVVNQGDGSTQDAANAGAVQKDDVEQSSLELLCGAIMENDCDFDTFFDLDAVGFVNGKYMIMRCPAMP